MFTDVINLIDINEIEIINNLDDQNYIYIVTQTEI